LIVDFHEDAAQLVKVTVKLDEVYRKFIRKG